MHIAYISCYYKSMLLENSNEKDWSSRTQTESEKNLKTQKLKLENLK